MSSPITQAPLAPVRLSEAQEKFIRSLLDEREVPADKRAVIGDPHTLDRQAASKVIEYLTNLPKKPRAVRTYGQNPSASIGWKVNKPAPSANAAPPSITQEGLYQVGTDIYKVQRSRQGRLYAEHLSPSGSFVYVKGAIYNLKPEHLMTVDQAKQYGIKWGRCCVCGKTLTDEKSIAAGIGPVCIKSRFFTQNVQTTTP